MHDIVSKTHVQHMALKLVGVNTLTCKSDGVWSNLPSTCEPIGMENPLYFSSYKLKLPGTQCRALEQAITVWYTSYKFQTPGMQAYGRSGASCERYA